MSGITRTLGGAAMLSLLLAACAEVPSAPESALAPNADLVAVDDYGFTWGNGRGAGCATGPGTCFGAGTGASRSYLGGLVHEAYGKLVTEQGQAAADAAFAQLWQLHEDAFALRKTGSQDQFAAAMALAHAESVRLVLSVLGTASVPTVVTLAKEKVAALEALIASKAAAGADVSRLQYVADRARTWLTAAEAALAAGDHATALDAGSRALQAASVAGGQKGMGQGMGSGSGQQRRRGR